MSYKFLNNLTVINSTFSPYNSGGTANDSLKVSSSNLGASFGVQNTNASGYAGIEYIDNSGNVKVFTGFNNGNGQEFRFNNVASGGYIDFLIGGTTGLKLFNNRNVTIGSATDAGYKLDVNGTARVVNTLTVNGTGTNIAIQFIGGRIDADGTFIRIKSPGNYDMVNIAQNFVGINATSVTPSAVFEVASTTRGFLFPRMTTTQRDAIATPATGLSIYNTTTNTEDYYNGSAWVSLQTSITNPVTGTGTTNYLSKWTSSSTLNTSLVYDNGTNVGIGTTSPSEKLQVSGNVVATRYYVGNSNGWGQYIDGDAGGGNMTIANGSSSGFTMKFVNSNSEAMRISTANNLLIGTTIDAGYKLDVNGITRFQGNSLVSLNQNAETSLIVSNTTSGTLSNSLVRATSSSGFVQMGKYSATTTTYKNVAANDGYIYNNAVGNISILNDVGTGNINFSARGSSSAQVIMNGDSQPLALVGGGSSNFSMNSGNDVYFYFNSQSAQGRFYANPQGTVQNTYDQPGSVGFVGTLAGGSVWYGNMYTSGGAVKYNASLNGTSHSHIWYYNFSEQMRLSYTGNLLVGTATDAGYKLDVNGTARVQGVITGSVNSGSLILGASAANSLAITITGYFTGNGAISTANSNARGFNTNTGGQSFGYSSSYTFNNQAVSTTDSYFRANGAINITAGTIALHGYNFSPTITSETGATIYAFSSTLNSASNHYNLYLSGTAQNYIAGNVGIGTSNLSSEANIYLGAKSTIEGGQLVLQKGTSQTYATHLDNYNDQFRVMVGTDTGSTAAQLIVMHATGNVLINSGTDNGYKLQVAGNVNVNTGGNTNNLVVNADTSMFYNLTSGGGQVQSNVYTTSVTTKYIANGSSSVALFEWDPTLCQGVFVDYVVLVNGANRLRSGTLVIVNDNGGNVTITDNINSSVNGSSSAVTFTTAGMASIRLFCNNGYAANDVYVNIVTRYIPNIY